MVRITGGGIQSNKTVQSRSGGKVEPVSRAGNVAGVAQTGLSHAFKPEPMIQGKGYEPGPMPPTGVKGNYNSATQGPGSQRTVYGSGSQSTYGKVDPGQRNTAPDAPATAPGKDILSQYGPEASGKGRR